MILFCGFGIISAGAQSLGDVNGSGSVDIVDALLVAQYYVGLSPANFNQAVADVNCSGGTDIVDALLIAQYYVGLVSQFSCSATPGPTTVPTAGPTGVPTTGPTNPPTGCTCAGGCSSIVAITNPFTKDGIGEFCFVAPCLSIVNSWGVDALTINGVDCANKYTTSFPKPIDGQFYIYYKASAANGHFESTGTCVPPGPTYAPTAIPAATPTAAPGSGVLYIGRFDTSDPAGPKFGWSATTVKANFQGTEVSVKLTSSGDNWFNVIVDGTVRTPVNVPSGTSGSTPILLASGLASGQHTIELVRRTEAWVGDVQFLGFTYGSGTELSPPAASARRIEFIGDSITCGYGIEGASQYQSFTTKNENAYLAYGSVTARLLGADQITVAWSGKGMIRNYGGDTTDTMPTLYPRTLPNSATPVWDSGKWIPQVAVVNLCTNDYASGIPDQTQFVTAYTNFVKKLRSQYSSAHIYCALGPMLSGDNLASARNYIGSVVSALNSAGDAKVHFIEFPVQDGSLGYGEDWHPSVATQALMADQLAARIQIDLGW